MTIARRQFLYLASGAAALPAIPRAARPQTYPTRPVHVVTSFGVGNVDDMLATLISQSLPQHFGQPFIIDNRQGGGIAAGVEAIKSALPDGYTLFLVFAVNVIAAMLDEKLNFNFVHDVTPVAGVSRNPLVLLVNPSIPAGSVTKFIAYAKPIRASSIWHQAAKVAFFIWLASCSK
jgi:tripartite-type tricarboxylate transporter receptor subunit TctC